MVRGAYIAYVVTTALGAMTEQLNLLAILIVIYTDSYSQYECLVKQGSTKEKQLMIGIIARRQMYEQELVEIRWINDNPTNSMIKPNPNTVLETNKLRIRVEG